MRLYAVACCRLLGALLHKPAYRTAVDVAEAFADGGAAEAMLAVAQEECMSAGPEHGFVNSQVQWAAWKVVWHTGNEWTQDPPALIAAIDSTSAVLNVLYRGAHTASPDAVRTSVIAVTAAQTALVRCAFGNPFRPVEFDPAWRTSDAVALAQSMYNSRDFTRDADSGRRAPRRRLRERTRSDALPRTRAARPRVLGGGRGAGPRVGRGRAALRREARRRKASRKIARVAFVGKNTTVSRIALPLSGLAAKRRSTATYKSR